MFIIEYKYVDMAKLVDAHDSGSCGEILGGSNPPIDTIKEVRQTSFLV